MSRPWGLWLQFGDIWSCLDKLMAPLRADNGQLCTLDGWVAPFPLSKLSQLFTSKLPTCLEKSPLSSSMGWSQFFICISWAHGSNMCADLLSVDTFCYLYLCDMFFSLYTYISFCLSLFVSLSLSLSLPLSLSSSLIYHSCQHSILTQTCLGCSLPSIFVCESTWKEAKLKQPSLQLSQAQNAIWHSIKAMQCLLHIPSMSKPMRPQSCKLKARLCNASCLFKVPKWQAYNFPTCSSQWGPKVATCSSQARPTLHGPQSQTGSRHKPKKQGPQTQKLQLFRGISMPMDCGRCLHQILHGFLLFIF